MGAIKSCHHQDNKVIRRGNSATLCALTSAALALPGLMHSPARAEDESNFSFQYSRYEEGGGTHSRFRDKDNDIQVDSLQTTGEFGLADRLKLRASFIQDTWSGATPLTTAPAAATKSNPNAETGASPYTDLTGGVVNFDLATREGIALDPTTSQPVNTTETVHVMAEASPETRKQGDFKLGYEWGEAALDLGGGISLEDDYESRYVNLGSSWDFNQKLTTLSLGFSYTDSEIDADRFRFRATSVPVDADSAVNPNFPDWSVRLRDDRSDIATTLGLSQVLDKNSVLNTSLNYTRSSGFLSNAYKESVFFAPLDSVQFPGQSLLFTRYDNRPRSRDQITWNIGYNRYFDFFDAALQLDYSFFHDDWEINAHTVDVSWGQAVGTGWIITPRVRYYSQTAADFYRPFFILEQEPLSGSDFLNTISGDPSLLITPNRFSSDHRLSGFGALSGGLTISKEFAKGIGLETGFEYYSHKGSLKLGGNGESDFADFNYFQVYAGLNVDLSSIALSRTNHLAATGLKRMGHEGHFNHSGHAPAGVMFSHMLLNPGDFMVGYRYRYGRQAGNTLDGTNSVDDQFIVNNGCSDNPCQLMSDYMTMNMHMLNIMYAPTDWLNLMLMPQFMDMDMELRELEGAPPPDPDANGGHNHGSGNAVHATGGVGDTGLFALVKLYHSGRHHLHMGLGVTAPTGDSDIVVEGQEINPDDPNFGSALLIHYGMQLGSGTWDFVPSVTYTGQLDQWSWGGQVNGVVRLEDENNAGFAFGDRLEATAWGSYGIFPWLSASVRGIYSVQGSVRGRYEGATTNSAPVDFPENYGGRYWDVGFGLDAAIPLASLEATRFSFEWIQPIEDDVNGIQLEREGALAVNWSVKF